jgi:hypothetical protein
MNQEKRSDLHPSSIERPQNIPDFRAADAKRLSDFGRGCRTNHVDVAILAALSARFPSAIALWRFG